MPSDPLFRGINVIDAIERLANNQHPVTGATILPGARYATASSIAVTVDRRYVSNTNLTVVSGTMNVVAVWLPASTTITGARFLAGSTGTTGLTQLWYALYTSALARVAVTADDTTAWVANTMRSNNFTTPYATPAEGLYYLAVTQVVATTPATLRVMDTQSNVATLVPIISATSSTGLTTASSAPSTAGALTGITGTPYAEVF